MDRVQDLERLEPAHNPRDMVVRSEEVKDPRARHHRGMTGQEKPVHMRLSAVQQGTHHRRNQLLRREQEEIPNPLRLCRKDRRRLGRCSRLKADREEDHLLCGILRRNGQRVERRVDNAHVGAPCLHCGETGVRPRDLQHIAERRDDDIVHLRIGNRRVDVVVGGYADRTAGA